jgi:gamma-glutamyl:cysteine ligase YbdK (ATP-grasp superfamily)
MNESHYFLSHLLALSSSSPSWAGRDTGLTSYSSVIWSSFPRTGIPPDFVSNDEYENHLGSRNAVEHVSTMLRDGTSADRQLDAHRGHGSLKAVVDRVCEEMVEGFLATPGEASQ